MQRPMSRRPTITPQDRFNKAPPGHSLTGTAGKWAWEKPPEHTTPDAAVDAIIDNLEKPEVQEQYVQLLAAGVSVEELVTTMTKFGFMEGKFTADVAEIIKPPLAFYLMGLASEYQIPAKVFTTRDGMPRTNYGMEDTQILNIMRDRNPDFAKFVMQRPEVNRQKQVAMMQEKQQGFLADQPMVEPEMEENVELPEDVDDIGEEE